MNLERNDARVHSLLWGNSQWCMPQESFLAHCHYGNAGHIYAIAWFRIVVNFYETFPWY